MMRIVVFDFDKTLIVNDSLTQLFLKESLKKPTIFVFFLISTFLYKLNLLSNTSLKNIMLKFLFKDEHELLKSINSNIRFTKTLVLEILRYHLAKGDCCIISTASLDPIVRNFVDCFTLNHSNLIVSASTFNYHNGRLFFNNNYGKNKIEELSILGKERFDILFTDDLRADKHLANAAKKVINIKGNKITLI
jgi:phosphoserine phosphatase